MIGQTLNHFRILDLLGEGGMGKVYRAEDTKLRREVAIKVLPPAFTADKERLARFEREAQLLAQLQHPNIASIYGIEDSGGERALVMELVEGPTLDERLEFGPLSLDEALAIARQIAEALEEAHEKGIVHRDLKPQNIKAPIEGHVKVLDFGLAKAMDPAAGSASAADLARSPTLLNSPTLTAVQGTELGVILGTAAYMAPEQARGGSVDKRADIWAFGVVLYEMLVGRSLFSSATVTDTLAGVLKTEIDFTKLPVSTPVAIRRLLRRCLERNPQDRLHDIADARIEIQEAMDGTEDGDLDGSVLISQHVRTVQWWRLPVITAVALALGLAVGGLLRPVQEPLPLAQAEILPPIGTELVPIGDAAGPVAVSPDGSQLAFTARDGDRVTRLYVRSLAAGEARVVPDSEGARYPFWSPDSRSLGFFDETQLMRIDISEGIAFPLAPANAARGASWGASGVIVYSPTFDRALLQISASGGEPAPASELDTGRQEGTHRFPSFLPDGRHFIFEVRGYNAWMKGQDGVFVGSIDDFTQRVQILPYASNAIYASGHLLFVRNGALCAQRFDPDRLALSGPVSILSRDVRFDRRYSFGAFSATASVLALQHAADQDTNELVWLDRSGRRLELVDGPGYHDGLTLSPDGTRAVVSIVNPATSRSHLEVFDLSHESSARLTFGDVDDYAPIWSPDGHHVLFARVGEQAIGLWIKPVDGSEAERRFRPATSGELLVPLSWSPDRDHVLLSSLSGGSLPTGFWILPASGEGEPERYTDSRSNGDIAHFSPDGRWVLFDANEGKGQRTYLARFPDTGGRWQVADDDAWLSYWAGGGSEILYVGGRDQLIALPVELAATSPRFGTPQSLFALPEVSISGEYFGVTPDGERILALLPVENAQPTPYTLILHWEHLLEPDR